jgi:hypothetical protein
LYSIAIDFNQKSLPKKPKKGGNPETLNNKKTNSKLINLLYLYILYKSESLIILVPLFKKIFSIIANNNKIVVHKSEPAVPHPSHPHSIDDVKEFVPEHESRETVINKLKGAFS